jgi:hypothetical protein
MKRRITIIHAPLDDGVAATVQQALEKAGLKANAWTENGKGTLLRGRGGSPVNVLLLSAASNSSPAIQKTVGQAADDGKTILTFRLDQTPLSKQLEFYLSATHWMDASSPPLEKHLEALAQTVRELTSARPQTARKGKISMVLGLVSILVIPALLSPAAIILGIMELRAIKRGRALPSSRKYAWLGMITATMGLFGWLTMMFLSWYWDISLYEEFINWLSGAN